MRQAFTLIELLVVIAIIGIMATAAVVEYATGREGARLKGAARDIYATMRLARAKALVTRQPCIVTYSSTEIGGEVSAKVEITAARIFSNDDKATATNLRGELVYLNGDEEPAEPDKRAAVVIEGKTEEPEETPTGETFEDVLFAPIDDTVMKGICIKVEKGEDVLSSADDPEAEKSKAKISVFSNVDYLVGKLRDDETRKASAEKKEETDAAATDTAATASDDRQERVDVVWGTNGCCEPHQVRVYCGGTNPESGLLIKVDRFGAARIVTGEDEP
ncbi:MAG: Tfp pilus assembly protein FimT/FimU [Kiritimatiellia bacterium]